MTDSTGSGDPAAQCSVDAAIKSRRAVRAFLDVPVPRDRIEEILHLAARAPSGSNIQPWQVIVLSGAPLRNLGAKLSQLALSGHEEPREFQYYPRTWREPCHSRRRQLGWAMYDSLGIRKGERDRMAEQHARNFDFFGAPVGLLFSMRRLRPIDFRVVFSRSVVGTQVYELTGESRTRSL
jgi:nitroreductase